MHSVDVGRWIESAIAHGLPSDPTPLEAPDDPSARLERLNESARDTRKAWRLRSPSHSSYLQHDASPKAKKAAIRESSAERSSTRAPSERDGRSRRASPPDGDPSDRYKRGPRRKTRPEIYEQRTDGAREGKRKRKHERAEGDKKSGKRKSKRRKKDKHHADPLRNFHAKSIPTERLTVSYGC